VQICNLSEAKFACKNSGSNYRLVNNNFLVTMLADLIDEPSSASANADIYKTLIPRVKLHETKQRTAEFRISNRRISKGGFALLILFL
jgi:hypothetical protein